MKTEHELLPITVFINHMTNMIHKFSFNKQPCIAHLLKVRNATSITIKSILHNDKHTPRPRLDKKQLKVKNLTDVLLSQPEDIAIVSPYYICQITTGVDLG